MDLRWTVRAVAPLVAAATASRVTRDAAAQAPRIPFAPGVQLTWASSIAGEPDYETVITIARGDSAEVTLRISWNRGAERRWQAVERPLSAAERLRARSMSFYASGENPNQFRGTTQSMASAAVLRELRQAGSVSIVLLVPELSGRPFRGTLRRAAPGQETQEVLVDDRPAKLPGIRARGEVDGEYRVAFDVLILDDERAPWVLDARLTKAAGGETGKRVLVRIRTGAQGEAVAKALESSCRASVHDIYFATGSDALDSTSAPALGGIAAALQGNAGWQITIIGHTDSIGTESSNLDLSRRRAARVRETLARDYGIPANRLQAEGRGEGQPVADNGTVPGRARNRRVDLVRACPGKGG